MQPASWLGVSIVLSYLIIIANWGIVYVYIVWQKKFGNFALLPINEQWFSFNDQLLFRTVNYVVHLFTAYVRITSFCGFETHWLIGGDDHSFFITQREGCALVYRWLCFRCFWWLNMCSFWYWRSQSRNFWGTVFTFFVVPLRARKLVLSWSKPVHENSVDVFVRVGFLMIHSHPLPVSQHLH